MLAAVVTSAIFLISYVIKTWFHGTTLYGGTGLARVVYLTILFSHLSLAIVVVPLVIISVIHGLRKRYKAHRAIARWTYPIWLYVSVTGVLVFLMLRPWYLGVNGAGFARGSAWSARVWARRKTRGAAPPRRSGPGRKRGSD